MQAILEVSRKLAVQRDLKGAARIANDAVLELIGADRAYCMYHDSESGALWVEGDDDHDGNAGRGLAGFAARTGLSSSAWTERRTRGAMMRGNQLANSSTVASPMRLLVSAKRNRSRS